MITAMWLLAIQGVIGAFDTFYYHEWKARLPARCPQTAAELKIHAKRDFLYAVIFGSLPWIAWHGVWAAALAMVLAAEIVLTMTDFVIESWVRKPIGDVYPGERVTHAVMGILYGAMLACLLPTLWQWWSEPSGLVISPVGPMALRVLLSLMAVGVLLSGLRDLYAAYQLPGGHWPWPKSYLAHKGQATS